MTWLALVLGVAAATLLDRFGDDVSISLPAVYAWAGLGVLNAALLTALPTLERTSPAFAKNVGACRAFLLATDLVWITGIVAVTGGVRAPFWVLYVPVVLFAAVSLAPMVSALFGLTATAALVGRLPAGRRRRGRHRGTLLLIGAVFPCIAWFNSTLSAAVWSMRSAAEVERDALTARVAQLAGALERAADGDLAEGAPLGEPDSADHQQLHTLSNAFNHTIANLRVLVDQIRSGGEQIGASAGELLATAEDHAASATQQSSAVSETTATIEELAATAAQIAETSEAVARYAAETLRYAEQGRTAVNASVDAMDTIAERVDTIAARALSLGEKSHEIGRILDVIDDLADQTNLLALNAPSRQPAPVSTAAVRRRGVGGPQAGRAGAGVDRADPAHRQRDPGRDQLDHHRLRGGREGGAHRRAPRPRRRRRARAHQRHGRRDDHRRAGDLHRHAAAALGLRPGRRRP
jgi:hypothetical protein